MEEEFPKLLILSRIKLRNNLVASQRNVKRCQCRDGLSSLSSSPLSSPPPNLASLYVHPCPLIPPPQCWASSVPTSPFRSLENPALPTPAPFSLHLHRVTTDPGPLTHAAALVVKMAAPCVYCSKQQGRIRGNFF